MLNIIKNFQAKEWFIITILMLLITESGDFTESASFERYNTLLILYNYSRIFNCYYT